jgi:hypothetical protein
MNLTALGGFSTSWAAGLKLGLKSLDLRQGMHMCQHLSPRLGWSQWPVKRDLDYHSSCSRHLS